MTKEEIMKEIQQLQFEEIQLLAPLREYESRMEALEDRRRSLRFFQRKERKQLDEDKALLMEEKRSQEAEIWKNRNQIHSHISELKKLL